MLRTDLGYPILILPVIVIVSLAVSLALIPFDKPVEQDAKIYYYCAAELAYNVNHPEGCDYLHNLGFSYFLAGFFGMVPREQANFELLSNIQRIITVLLSTATIPIIYKLARNFFDYRYAVIGAGLFAFEYRIIENSAFGITEPLFLILSITALYFATARHHNFAGFAFTILATLIRVEGLFLFAAVLILYYHTTRKKRDCYAWLAILAVPVMIFGVEQFQHEMLVVDQHVNGKVFGQKANIWYSIGNSFLYMGWSTFPNFIFLIPFGLYAVYKKKQFRLWFALLGIMAAPGLWSYLDAYDTRYFFPMYPFLIILCLYGLKPHLDKLARPHPDSVKDKLRKTEHL